MTEKKNIPAEVGYWSQRGLSLRISEKCLEDYGFEDGDNVTLTVTTDDEEQPQAITTLQVELADNGIIVRNPENPDDVQIAPYGQQYEHHQDLDEAYRLLGQRLYDWLLEVAMVEYSDLWISTGATLDITATLDGRPRDI